MAVVLISIAVYGSIETYIESEKREEMREKMLIDSIKNHLDSIQYYKVNGRSAGKNT